MDLLLEPEECRALFERLADYKIDLFNHIRDVFPLDYLVAADDYGTALAPFFSTEVYEELLLEPTRRFVQAVQARGTKFFAHCCGKVEVFVPYFADDLKVDGIEIQDINDLPRIVSTYGDRLLIEVKPDPKVVYDDEMTDAQLIEHIHRLVDTYGAQANPGSGAVMNLGCGSAHGFYLMEEELYQYSKKQYSGL
jgi:uroporphyrinogen-III decarboxylase